jgi:uncharacterized small protein (DUF1192 family)
MEEETEIRQGSPLANLLAEDLSLMSQEELAQRMMALENEIARSAAMLESKKGSRCDAEAFFKS